MTDKPLDCIGTTGKIGKHDFRENSVEKMAKRMRELLDAKWSDFDICNELLLISDYLRSNQGKER
jgi:hypothetical protein